jgi:hypothetical protein
MANQLLLTRVDLMKDEFEGSVTRGVYEAWRREYPAEIERMFGAARRMMYVSCWHANNDESEAMWRLYCGNQGGVALRTSYATLDRCTHPEAFIGEISYIDFSSSDRLPADNNYFTPFMYKRLAFRHEQEVRVVMWRRTSRLPARDEGEPPTMGLDWNIGEAIENVFVSPYAPEWYRDVVEGVLQKFAPVLATL